MSMPKDFTFTDYKPYDFANRRHIGPSPAEMDEMLKVVGYPTLDALLDRGVQERSSEVVAEEPRAAVGDEGEEESAAGFNESPVVGHWATPTGLFRARPTVC